MVKADIRKIYNDARNNLSHADIKDMSEKIVSNFQSVSLQGAQVLMSYYPIAARKEFDVTVCEELLILENEHLQVAWPRLTQDYNMQAVAVHKSSVMVENKFNILEPVGDEIIEPQLIDVIFVPLLAFDTKGYRVGYGKGFYDRFLTFCAQDIVKIGFSYFDALETIDDVHQYDIPLTYCITPTRVYEF
jgi:5-formyltetrahydrofolate cyclo-ligase